jgi:activating signal cointegrator 1
MKALSLWQPWASAIASGAKHYETRPWRTSYRGPIAIHAAKRRIRLGDLWSLRGRRPDYESWWKAVCDIDPGIHVENGLPLGCIVAVGFLTAVNKAEELADDELDRFMDRSGQLANLVWCERQLGDFSAGRHAWRVDQVRRLLRPIECTGRQGLFEVPDVLFDDIPKPSP